MDVMRNPGEAPAAAAVLRHADEGSQLEILGARYVFKATSAETAGSFCCIEVSVPPGRGVPPHTHTHEDEAFHVLAGKIVIDCAGLEGPQCLGPGGFFFGPRGLRHAFRNEGAEEARLLVFCLPGAGIEAMFRQMDAAGRGGEPSIATILAIAASAGVDIASEPEPAATV